MDLEFVCFFVTTNGCIKTRYVYGSINELKTVVVVIVVVCFLMADHVSIKMHGSLFGGLLKRDVGLVFVKYLQNAQNDLIASQRSTQIIIYIGFRKYFCDLSSGSSLNLIRLGAHLVSDCIIKIRFQCPLWQVEKNIIKCNLKSGFIYVSNNNYVSNYR